jgi:hypothetical protein
VTLSSLSLEFIKVPVSVVLNGVAYDPHSDPVALSFPLRGAAPTVWTAGSWESDGAGGWQARILVGPGGVLQLAPGTYDCWIRVTDSPEQPIRKAGIVEVV